MHLRKSNEVAIVQEPNSNGDHDNINAKKVLTKMDLHLIPMVTLLYLLSFLDRGNIGNAQIEGLTESLKMSGAQFNWSCAVFPSCSLIHAYGFK